MPKTKYKEPSLEELKKPVLTSKFMEDGLKKYNELQAISKIVEDRTHYIMMFIFKLFKFKEDYYWYFYGAGEEETGTPWKYFKDNKKSLSTCIHGNYDELVIILNDGSEWGLEDGIPVRWLYEDFEEELIEGKKKWKDKIANQSKKDAENLKLKELKKQELLKSALKKLTKEELDALTK